MDKIKSLTCYLQMATPWYEQRVCMESYPCGTCDYCKRRNTNTVKSGSTSQMEREFVAACENGNFQKVQELTAKGVNIHVQRNNGLGWAAKKGFDKIVKHLIDAGANVRDNDGLVLQCPIQNGHTDVVELLLKAGALVIEKGDVSFLGDAVHFNHLDIVKLLFKYRPDLNVNPPGKDILTWAVNNGNLEMCEFLVQKGANVNADEGKPLHVALQNKNCTIAAFLVRNGANCRIEDDIAICIAAHLGNLQLVKLLVEKGANINARNGLPYRWGKVCYPEIECFLREKGAIDIPDTNAH
jgi:ankyrin repeat protein